jgi:hypothetical protein
MRRSGDFALILATLCAVACHDSIPTTPDVSAGAAQGPTTIEFVRASPEPGSTVTGCGSSVRGCAGQLTVWVRMLNQVGGSVDSITASLHGQSKIACLLATAPPVTLRVNSYSEVLLRFTVADSNQLCATPWNAVNLAVVSNGTISTLGRREFAVRYRFEQ